MMLNKIDSLASAKEPFLFFTDFKASCIEVYRLDELAKNDIEFTFDENFTYKKHDASLIKHPISFYEYKKKFDEVIENIKAGNTYLFNLTAPTAVECDHDLKEIFQLANAPFKLRVRDEFVCFSPERFVTIQGSRISTFPMKGTIDASVENAKEKILSNEKEMAEHVMIVDLLRNDLGIVAKDIKVEKFRYTEVINAGEKKLLHVSSKITGCLPFDWQKNLSQILLKLLPAGSISGTPKRKTVELIEKIEAYQRGYFSGIFGFFDGQELQSAVMIRFIEKKDGKLIYKSGGGITLDSDVQSEYKELIDKIYIP
ncbi:aminodeoxychorismate synthase component I [Sulfurimonas sp. HSL-1716]|uniref:aminodeoxychorismate synthase component I n=1 Tax=Hydrocurvibacter sulfurireducens TaxID=3131937 RepID=UPI0031F74710